MADGAGLHGPFGSPGFLLWHVSLRWRALLAERLQPLGLTPAQFDVLAAVAWVERQGAAPMQRDVAAQAGTDPMMTSQILRTLAQSKLVVRRPDPDDGRAWRIATTPLGLRLVGEGVTIVGKASEVFFDQRLGDVASLVGSLRALIGPSGPTGSRPAVVAPARSGSRPRAERRAGRRA